MPVGGEDDHRLVFVGGLHRSGTSPLTRVLASHPEVSGPAVVALSTRQWRRRMPVRDLLEHWVRAHEVFLADAPALRQLHVVAYEELVARPRDALPAIADFLELESPLSSATLRRDRSERYVREWDALTRSRLPWVRRPMQRMLGDLEPRVRPMGYTLTDLRKCEGFPGASADVT